MTHPSGPKQSFEQQKEFSATSRRRFLYVAAVGGVLMIPLTLAMVPLFIFEDDKWDFFQDHYEVCIGLSMMGATFLGTGLSLAGHCRKEYEKLVREEAASRDPGPNVEHASAD